MARWLCAHGALLALAACGGGGDGGEPPNQSGEVTISGVVTFDYVPAVAGLGLAYDDTTAKPARGVTVELVGGGAVLASTTSDANGGYSFTVARNAFVAVRARAEMLRTGSPAWDVRVVDNTSSDALYVLEGSIASSGNANSVRSLHAASGWGGTRYTEPRSAAPFAILDTVYDAAQFVLAADPTVTFPPLVVHWSPNNVPSLDSKGLRNTDTGELGTTFFRPGEGIFLLGAENLDTEEYDRHVIVHEWGHYFEDAFSRSDSIGGPHTRGDQLDMRVAFGEGWGNALSAMVTGQSVYRDILGWRQSSGFAFDVEGPLPLNPNPRPGWYSEESVQEILYDLFDDSGLDVARDGVTLGFAPLFSVLANQQRASVALTSIFSFIDALKGDRPAEVGAIDNLVSFQNISRIDDEYATNETNLGVPESPDYRTVYDTVTVGGGSVEVCSIDDFGGPESSEAPTGSTNKLGSRRFVRFTVNVPGPHTMTAVAKNPLNAAADPDMVLHRGGEIGRSTAPPDELLCTQATPAGCRETFTRTLDSGDYVLEVYEWTNTNAHEDEYPPIGRTCFDVTVTQP